MLLFFFSSSLSAHALDDMHELIRNRIDSISSTGQWTKKKKLMMNNNVLSDDNWRQSVSLNHNCTRWYDCLVFVSSILFFVSHCVFVSISLSLELLSLVFRVVRFRFKLFQQTSTTTEKKKNCICLVAVWMRLLWTFNYDWCLLLCDKLYRCGGVCVVGANVPQLQLIRICVNVPKGCLQISFLTVWMPWMRLLCRMYWAFSGCVNLVDFVADRFHRWCI